MSKKSLTDLLREEAGKNSSSEGNDRGNPTEFTDKSTENLVKTSDAEATDAEATDTESRSQLAIELQAALSAEQNTVAKLATQLQESNEQKDELEKDREKLQANFKESQSTIKKLQTDLKKASQRHDRLEKTKADLKNQLQDQKKQVKKLQADLKAIEQVQAQLKSELETVTNTARQFAEDKEKLQADLTALQEENQALKHQGGRLVYQTGYALLSKDKFLYNSLSNEDIGWFD